MSNPDELELRLAGEEFLMTRYNASLFTFMGANAIYDHVFLVRGETDENQMIGTYIFKQNSAYSTIAGFMVENRYPQHLNANDVPDCDQNAWRSHYAGDLDGGVPDDWLK